MTRLVFTFFLFHSPQQAMVIPLVHSAVIQWHQYIPASPYCASAEGNLHFQIHDKSNSLAS